MSATRENIDVRYRLLSETKSSCLTQIGNIPKGIFSRLGSMAGPGGWVPGLFQSGSFTSGAALLTKAMTGTYDLLGFILPIFGAYDGRTFRAAEEAAPASENEASVVSRVP